jgi:hypothetical protein
MKLKTNKLRTFADVAKPLQALIEKAKSRPASQARDNTIMLLEKQLDDLFAKQEAMKEAENPQPQMPMEQPMQGMEQPQMPMQPEGLPMEQPEMAYGGYLNKYFGGGDKDPFENPPIEETVIPQQIPQAVDFVRNQNNQSFAQPFLLDNKPSYTPKVEALQKKPSYIPTPFIQAGGYTNPYDYNYMNLDDKAVQAEQERVKKLNSANTATGANAPKQGFKRWGEVGALGAGMASTFRQNRNINNVDRPDVLNNVYLSAGAAPDKVDYSAELNALNADAAAAREGLRLSGGNTSAMLGNLGAIRAQQLQRRGQVMQGQENTNTGLINEYKARQAEAAMKSQLTNAGIAQENMANEFGYNQWLAKQRNAAIANETQLTNDVFNNMTNRQNQLDAANIMANANPSTVIRDMIKGNKPLADSMLAAGKISQEEYNRALGIKAMGGMKYADGGSVFKKKLQTVLQDKTVDRAAQMDAEYASYLNKEGQPTQNTFKSKITGLDYKVLPRGEKDLYAAQLWKETLGTAPTKSQKEATKKALEGKPTSSTKAITVVENARAKTTQESLSNTWSTEKPSWLTPEMEKAQEAINKDRDFKIKQANEAKTIKSLKMFNPAAARYYEQTGDLQGALDNYVAPDRFDVASGSAGFSMGKAVKEGTTTGLDYTNLALMAVNLASSKRSPKPLGPKKPQFMESFSRNAELAKATNARGKGSYTYRQKKANEERLSNWEQSGRGAKLDMESTPEYLNKKRNAIVNKEDESFVYEQNRVKNKKLDNSLSEQEVPEFKSLVSFENASLKNKIRIIESNLTKAKNSKDAKKIAYWTNKKLSVMEDNYAFGGIKR